MAVLPAPLNLTFSLLLHLSESLKLTFSRLTSFLISFLKHHLHPPAVLESTSGLLAMLRAQSWTV